MNRIATMTVFVAVFGTVALKAQDNPFRAEAAEKMPEDDFSFKTVPAVRTYGEIIAHAADAQMAIKASFDSCDPIYDSMTGAAGAVKAKMFGREMTRIGILNFNTMHDNEMYGTMVAYLRLKGIVPPSSEGRP